MTISLGVYLRSPALINSEISGVFPEEEREECPPVTKAGETESLAKATQLSKPAARD